MHTKTLGLLNISDLKIDPMAQRENSQRRVDRMLQVGFDPDLAAAIFVGQDPDGTLYVIDGQCRMRAAEASGLTEVLAVVAEGVDQMTRARWFVVMNRDRRNVAPYDIHRVGVIAGLAEPLAVERVVTSRSLEVGRGSSERSIAGVVGLNKILRRYGEDILAQTLDMILGVWPATGGERWQSDLMQGIGENLALNITTVDHARYRDVLRRNDPMLWKAHLAARTAGPGGSAGRPRQAAEMFAAAYNSGLRGGVKGIPLLKTLSR